MDELLSSCEGLVKKVAQNFYNVDKEELYHVTSLC